MKLSPGIQTPVAVRAVLSSYSRQERRYRRKEQLGTSPVIDRLYTFYARPKGNSGSANARTQSKKPKKKTQTNQNKKTHENKNAQKTPQQATIAADLLPVVGAHSGTHLFRRLP